MSGMSPESKPSQALHLLYTDHHGWLQGWLRRRLGCASDAADLAHDTFLRLLHRQDADAVKAPRPFLSTVAHGLLVSHLRRKDLERAYLDALRALPLASVPSPEDRAIVLDTLMRIDAMLDALAPRVRYAFLANQLEGRSHADIAAALGVSVSSIRQYITKALRHCVEIAA